ncbi:hypothetical protein I4U23_027908 [Adineta vaga]|nr:hypothetical protein I4U23_027908 [Adineta vaga]
MSEGNLCVMASDTTQTSNRLSWRLRAIIRLFARPTIAYILNIDDSCTLNVANEQLSDSEVYSTLRSIGNVRKKIWKPDDLFKHINNIIEFCAATQNGHVNRTVLKNLLSSLFKEEISEERTTVDVTETIVIYSSKENQCGVMKLAFTGEQFNITNCCFKGTQIKLNVKKLVIMFDNTQDLLFTLRTFVEADQ